MYCSERQVSRHQCCGSRTFWYRSGFSLWSGSGTDCLIRIRNQLFDPDPGPDPYHFKEVMYLKRHFLYIFTWFSLSVGPTGPTQKVFFVRFSLPVIFVVLIGVAYGSGSDTQGTDQEPEKWYASLRIRIHNTCRHRTAWIKGEQKNPFHKTKKKADKRGQASTSTTLPIHSLLLSFG